MERRTETLADALERLFRVAFETDYDEKRYLEDLIEIRRLAESAISHAKWRLAIKDDEALARIRDWDDRRRWC